MSDRILETAEKYRQLAQDISVFEADKSFDNSLPMQMQTALLRLYYAKSLEARLDKCEALLTEETEQETVDVLTQAAQTVDDAAASAMGQIEDYGRQDAAFARMLDVLSMGTTGEGLKDLLCKLYKCENIIAMAYSYASAHSYTTTPEEYMKTRMDIDIEALFEQRETLLDSIARVLDATS